MKKIIFMGTPLFAAEILQYVASNLQPLNAEIIGVYTQPDKPAGRGKKLQESQVKQKAIALNIPVYQPMNFKKTTALEELAALKPDILLVAAYGLILPQSVLDIPTLGAYNVHASLLPQWRGAAPVQRAILAGDTTTGITIMRMEKGLDTGDMLLQKAIPISPEDTSTTLLGALADLGGKLSITALSQIFENRAAFITQNNSKASYAHKIEKEDYLINWENTAQEIDRKVRALEKPKASLLLRNNETIQVQIIKGSIVPYISPAPHLACGAIISANNMLLISTIDTDKAYSIELLKPQGKSALNAQDFINGYIKPIK